MLSAAKYRAIDIFLTVIVCVCWGGGVAISPSLGLPEDVLRHCWQHPMHHDIISHDDMCTSPISMTTPAPIFLDSETNAGKNEKKKM